MKTQLVPVDPTEKMKKAAPTPPASIAWPRECEELCKAAEQFQRAVGELWKAENPDELQDGDTAMSEEEARELHSERWKALESAIYYMRKRMSAPPTPPAQDDEPVAWMIEIPNGDWKEVKLCRHNAIGDYRTPCPDATSTPLYTRPDNSGLRKAAGDALEILEEINSVSRCALTTEIIESLRAALEGK